MQKGGRKTFSKSKRKSALVMKEWFEPCLVQERSMGVKYRVVRRPSVCRQLFNFSKKWPDNFFSVFEASLGWYQCTVNMLIWLNHDKGHL